MYVPRIITGVLAGVALAASGAVSTPAVALAPASPVYAKQEPSFLLDVEMGPAWSAGRRAKTSGHLVFSREKEGSPLVLRFSGKLWDRDPGRRCAYFQSKVKFSGVWQSTKSSRKCGGTSPKKIAFQLDSGSRTLEAFTIRACQIGKKATRPTKCGPWSDEFSGT
ncbi:hypothetical protein Aph01nite_16910 [Acrocarpospora phusangensis]|uniref:Uncharacterized protein n=1 Tax=Acrocarpospora phusangensis TaxID=1070424 RepID=A0A919Q731_9ACTN|nr:hypothetical protein [Acrocarpospora phusangensis]GIH23381.1 hypothetical protein Aph01nite_16910 [Acrocarpospora phusangensis]